MSDENEKKKAQSDLEKTAQPVDSEIMNVPVISTEEAVPSMPDSAEAMHRKADFEKRLKESLKRNEQVLKGLSKR